MSHSFIHIILSAVILDILQYGHPLLREECGPVVHINRDILSFLDDMQETLAQGGIGLAAPQVGRPIQLVTINIPSTDATTTWLEVDGCPTTLSRLMPLNFINPILHPFGKKVPYREGCLSITKVYANVMRRSCVRAVLTMMDGRTVTVKCNGLLARCLQHEVDHLHGGLFTDLVSPGDHDKVIRRLRLTHPDAFEEDDDSYARRMKEKRRSLPEKQPDVQATNLSPLLLPFPKKRPGFLEENRGIHNHMERKRENQPIQSRTTLPDFPEFMASNPSRNSV